jgi:imidazolonepropionase-like amidohydrolase
MSPLPRIAACFCSALLAGCASLAIAPAGTTLVVRNVSVVDTEHGASRAPQDVFIVGDRIALLRPADAHAVTPAGALAVDGSGKFLAPGLWDMHAHWWDEAFLPLFTLNGVTGIRQMRGYTMHHAWRKKGIEGTPAGPRTILASPLVDGEPPIWSPSLSAATPGQARASVQLIAQSGADFLKPYDKIPREAYLALLQEAGRLGVRVEGHVPTDVGWMEAAQLGGQRSFEHLMGLEESAADNSGELARRGMALEASYNADTGPTPLQRAEGTRLLNEAIDHYDGARFAALARDLAQRPGWMVPTLVLRAARLSKFDAAMLEDARLAQLPAWIRDYWKDSIPPIDDVVQGDIDANSRRLQFYLARTRELHAAGVPLLIGTDTGNPFVFPGTSVHEEMQLFAKAGLPPLAILQAATRNVGLFLEREDVGEWIGV